MYNIYKRKQFSAFRVFREINIFSSICRSFLCLNSSISSNLFHLTANNLNLISCSSVNSAKNSVANNFESVSWHRNKVKMASIESLQNKTWDLSLYELNREPQEAITDSTEIAVSPRSLHSELMCPICLDMLKKTMTTKECLHRFCSDCIITALRSGNKECPTCRKKLVSKRSLRPDPNFDLLISKIYPSRDEYEAHQERVMAKFNRSHSQAALVNSITEGIKLQSQNRQQRTRKQIEQDQRNAEIANNTVTTVSPPAIAPNADADTTATVGAVTNRFASNPPSVRSTPSPVPSNVSSGSKAKRARSILTASERSEESESNSEVDYSRTEGNDSNLDTEGEGTSELGVSDEIELVFKPHPTEMTGDNELMKSLKNSIRYLKTTANATGE